VTARHGAPCPACGGRGSLGKRVRRTCGACLGTGRRSARGRPPGLQAVVEGLQEAQVADLLTRDDLPLDQPSAAAAPAGASASPAVGGAPGATSGTAGEPSAPQPGALEALARRVAVDLSAFGLWWQLHARTGRLAEILEACACAHDGEGLSEAEVEGALAQGAALLDRELAEEAAEQAAEACGCLAPWPEVVP
jgi:hypothetical protein